MRPKIAGLERRVDPVGETGNARGGRPRYCFRRSLLGPHDRLFVLKIIADMRASDHPLRGGVERICCQQRQNRGNRRDARRSCNRGNSSNGRDCRDAGRRTYMHRGSLTGKQPGSTSAAVPGLPGVPGIAGVPGIPGVPGPRRSGPPRIENIHVGGVFGPRPANLSPDIEAGPGIKQQPPSVQEPPASSGWEDLPLSRSRQGRSEQTRSDDFPEHGAIPKRPPSGYYAALVSRQPILDRVACY